MSDFIKIQATPEFKSKVSYRLHREYEFRY